MPPGKNECYLSIIVPSYNEERRMPRCLEKLAEYLERKQFTSEVLIVSDGSTDRTTDIVRAASQMDPTIRLIEFSENKGKGFAVRAGMLEARGKYRLFMDTDCAVPVEFIDKMLERLVAGYEVAIGSRALEESVIVKRQSLPRHVAALGFTKLQNAVLKLPFADTQCGFKMFSAQAAEHLFPLTKLNCAYFDAELLYMAYKFNYEVAEVPVKWTHDEETRLPIGPRRSADLLIKLLQIPSIHRRKNWQNRTGALSANNSQIQLTLKR
ncbi:MAG TPA: glycosyltransferase family 2 protein [Candidatus Melainabacteria bacterium]|nr:glycosyltransferase family 2 protein [Candidatus Melainabacteria bacterium]HIN66584.1 glycosyltransferase family 2 protein [Candidatus Obscuribacterales bacterium]